MTTRAPRVVVVQPALAPYRVAVFQELARRDLSLRVVHASTPGLANAPADSLPREISATFEPMSIARVAGQPIYWQRSQLAYATRERADVLVLNWDVHYLSLAPALLRARAEKVGTVLWGHGYSRHATPARSVARRSVARLAGALLLYNKTGAEVYRRASWAAERTYVAPNSLDQRPIAAAREAWRSDGMRLSEFQRAHDLNAGPVLLFVARLDARRRVDLLLRAAAALVGEFPDLRVVIVGGGGGGGGGAEESALRALARELRIDANVLLPGPVYGEEQLAPWFLSADAFCFPSYLGLSLLHAFGYGVPVVAGDDPLEHGPEIEALRDGENGLLFPSGDAAAMAERLRQVLRDGDLRARLSAGALRTASEYTIPRMVDGMEAAIRSAARRAGVPA